MSTRRIEMAGRKFGRLKVVDLAGIDKGGRRTWRCVCQCGTVVPAVVGQSLRSGHSRSCGCLKRETQAARVPMMNAARDAAAAARRAGVAA